MGNALTGREAGGQRSPVGGHARCGEMAVLAVSVQARGEIAGWGPWGDSTAMGSDGRIYGCPTKFWGPSRDLLEHIFFGSSPLYLAMRA